MGIQLQENCGYILKLSDRLIHAPADDPLVVNWNKGQRPQTAFYKASVEQILPDRVKITGIGYDYENKTNLTNTFFGWIPLSEMEVIEKYNVISN